MTTVKADAHFVDSDIKQLTPETWTQTANETAIASYQDIIVPYSVGTEYNLAIMKGPYGIKLDTGGAAVEDPVSGSDAYVGLPSENHGYSAGAAIPTLLQTPRPGRSLVYRDLPDGHSDWICNTILRWGSLASVVGPRRSL